MRQIDHESKRRLLLSSPLFDALPREALDDILLQASEKSVRRGQTVFQKGDEGNYMVAVLSGRIRISATSPEGREVTLNMIDAGEVFGDMALLDGKPRSADATALEESNLMVVERRHFLPYLVSSNELALRVIDLLCERLRDTSETLGNFAMLDLPGRLARKLLNLAGEYGKSANGKSGWRSVCPIPISDVSSAAHESRLTSKCAPGRKPASWLVRRDGSRCANPQCCGALPVRTNRSSRICHKSQR